MGAARPSKSSDRDKVIFMFCVVLCMYYTHDMQLSTDQFLRANDYWAKENLRPSTVAFGEQVYMYCQGVCVLMHALSCRSTLMVILSMRRH